MKKHNLYKTGLTAILFALYGGLFTACSETEFDAKYIDESQFEVSSDQMGYLADIDGEQSFHHLKYRLVLARMSLCC